jgi:hypothetical protein
MATLLQQSGLQRKRIASCVASYESGNALRLNGAVGFRSGENRLICDAFFMRAPADFGARQQQ